ncbi:MAG: hypothetical protein DYG96_07695 [Chlorobi bacterium CHB2]|nr:hypothetical protein [Chlorobi bacterium CHB2]
MRYLLALLCLLFCSRLLVAGGHSADARPFSPNVLPTLEVQRTATPPTIDGMLDDPCWRDAHVATNFAEFTPGDRAKPLVNTEAMVAYDDHHLYVAFRCYDDPAAIRASFTNRDLAFNDDQVGLILDTYGDAGRAYEIFTTANGVQGDLLWTNDNEDASFDMIFESEAQITSDGYLVEMAIPFSSIRFPDQPEQKWRATFWRIHPRDSRREYSWSAISKDDPCQFCQYGTLTGIKNIKPGGKWQFLPAVIASQSATIANPNDPNSGLKNEPVHGDAGLGIRYDFTPSITGELAINPDFSQIESDNTQLGLNTTFALFYPERRPFFQEGSDLFDTWINAVYTRSINNPLVAAKLIGKSDKLSVGYIGAYDENTALLLPFEEFTGFVAGAGDAPLRSVSNILRLRRAFGNNNYIGAMVTDRRLIGGGSGTTAGLDGIVRFAGNWQVETQFMLSHTKEPTDTVLTEAYRNIRFDEGRHTAKFDGETIEGTAAYVSLERGALNWSLDFDYTMSSPGFRAADGFIFNNSRHEVNLWTGYAFYPTESFIFRIQPNAMLGRVWNWEGTPKDFWLRPGVSFDLKGQTSFSLAYLISHELFRGVQFPGIRRAEIYASTNPWQEASMGTNLSFGRTIARSIPTPVLGRGMDISLWGTFKPFERLTIAPEAIYSKLDYPDERGNIFEATILRLRLGYQFNRELSARLVCEYVTEGELLRLEPLLTYKLNSFSVFYLGSSHAMADYPAPAGLTQTDRQLFLKFQYLWKV